MRCVVALGAVALAVAALASADVILLEDGSRLVGRVVGVAPGKVMLATDFAGTLALESKRIVQIDSESLLHVAFADGRRLAGTLAATPAGTVLLTESGDLPITASALQGVQAVWPEGLPDPTAARPAERRWSHELGVDLAGKSGNSRKNRIGGSASSVLAGPEDRTALHLHGAWAEEDGTKTEDEIIGGVDYERIVTKNHTWYSRAEVEKDAIEALNLRTTVAGGYGYYLIKQPANLLRLRGGLQYRHEDYLSGRTDDTVSPEFGLRYEGNLRTWAKLVSEVTYALAIDDLSNYRVDHTSGLDFPLDPKGRWVLRLGVTNSYNSNPAEDLRRLETTYMARLMLKLP